MWMVGLLAGIAALVAIALKASRRGRTGLATSAGGADTFLAGEAGSGPDGTASDCTDATSDGGGCGDGGD
jgi:hypothetical protein